MTAKKKPEGTSDREWFLAAWEWCGEVTTDTRLATQVSVTPTARKGVWRLRGRLCHHVDGKLHGVVAQVETEWPSSAHQSFAGAFHALLMKLDAVAAQELFPGTIA